MAKTAYVSHTFNIPKFNNVYSQLWTESNSKILASLMDSVKHEEKVEEVAVEQPDEHGLRPPHLIEAPIKLQEKYEFLPVDVLC